MAKRLKITQILEATGGGTRRHLLDLVKGLEKERFEVSVICSSGREEGFKEDIQVMETLGIRVEEIPMSAGFSPVCDRAATRQVAQVLREIQPDIVHTHSTKAGWIGRRAAARCGVRTIIHSPHCWPFDIRAPWLCRHLVAHIERKLAPLTSAFICGCPSEKKSAETHSIAPAEKLHVIPNGINPHLTSSVETAAFSLPPEIAAAQANGGIVIGLVGRLSAQKGILWFLDAVAPVLKDKLETRLVFVGDGPLRETIQKRCHKLDIRRQCVFTGYYSETRWLYPFFDLVVMPSLWEGLPYALLDAMQAGKAIIASDVGGLSDVLANGCGLLVAPNDHIKIKNALLELMENPCLRNQLAEKAVNSIDCYDLKEMVYKIKCNYVSFQGKPALCD